jgi:hypothetical protein
MRRNWVYLIRRVYRYQSRNDIAIGGKMEAWFSLQGWVDKRKAATFFSTKEKAESRALLLATEKPEWIGQLSIVRLSRPKGITVDV